MWQYVVLLNLILCSLVVSKRRQHKDSSDASGGGDLGSSLVTALRNDVNVDLSMDEEYEDLRAELLAYHTALATLTSGRRSLKTTPCWQLGGVCIAHEMCEGHRFLSEVPGCKNKLQVCCFSWNHFYVRDMRDKGLGVAAMPWPHQYEFGGKGVLGVVQKAGEKKKKKKKSTPPTNQHSDYDHDEESLRQDQHHDDIYPQGHEEKHHQRHRAENQGQYHENIHQEHHNKNSDQEKSPVLVLLRTEKKK